MVSRAARVWLPALTLLGVLVVAVARAARPLTNPDTYFPLRFGAEFLAGWSLRDPGSVSTSATRDWLPFYCHGRVSATNTGSCLVI